MEYIIFIFGLFLGSFYNVCIYRIPNKESIAYPPSKCQSCNHQLKAIDLVPVLSYVLLKGKCRYCGAKVSMQYPIIEIITGFIFLFTYKTFGFNIYFFKGIVLGSIVLIITMIDLKHYIIPDSISLFTLITGIIFNVIIRDLSIRSLIFAFLLGGGFLFIIALFGPMGGGDIKIMAGFALYLGLSKTIMALFLSFLLGGVIGIILLTTKIKSRKDVIPFGPYLGVSSFLSFMFFNEIFNWYLRLL